MVRLMQHLEFIDQTRLTQLSRSVRKNALLVRVSTLPTMKIDFRSAALMERGCHSLSARRPLVVARQGRNVYARDREGGIGEKEQGRCWRNHESIECRAFERGYAASADRIAN